MRIGETNTLKVVKKLQSHYLLEDSSGKTVELHKKEISGDCSPGEMLDVFVVNGRQACYGTPKAIIGDFAALKVNSVQDFGVFLDWGISKDLFVPNRNLIGKPQTGDTLVVYIMPDFEGEGILGTMYLKEFIRMDTESLNPDMKVPLLIYEQTPLGYNVIIDNRYSGLVYKNEVFRPLRTGDRLDGYIKKIREDGGIDVSLQPLGFQDANSSAEQAVLEYLGTHGGKTTLHDKSSPEEISAELKMSKKSFKRAIGTLYKAGKIIIRDDGINLSEDDL